MSAPAVAEQAGEGLVLHSAKGRIALIATVGGSAMAALDVHDAGEGTPVVLLHGLTATHRYVVMGSRALERSGHRVIAYGQPVPKGGGSYKVGDPYQIDGQWHTPREDPGYDRTGIASYYAHDFHGRRTANGEIFDMSALSAAHPTLPLPSLVYVTNMENGRTLLLRVNDRGPYVNNRVIDVSRAAAGSPV